MCKNFTYHVFMCVCVCLKVQSDHLQNKRQNDENDPVTSNCWNSVLVVYCFVTKIF